MRFSRLCIVLGLLAITTSCGTTAPPPDLSRDEQEAYLVLMAELKDLAASGPNSEAQWMCLSVNIDGKSHKVSADFFAALSQDAPTDVKAVFVDGKTCTEDNFGQTWTSDHKRALDFFAGRDKEGIVDGVGKWMAGWTCASLCGGGNFYDIEMIDGVLTAKVVGGWAT